MRVLAAFDSFKGTVSAPAIGRQLTKVLIAHEVVACPLSDGGEGFVDVLAEQWEEVEAVDALGRPCSAKLGIRDDIVIIEAAQVIGLAMIGGAAGNDPVRADSSGVTTLLESAVRMRPRAVLVGCGGSATTDGGIGLVRSAEQRGLVPCPVPLRAALDVRTVFTQAARVFGPQKGASELEVHLLSVRLEALRRWYQRRYGVDVDRHPGTGAAGGLGGALLVIGGALTSGFGEVAERVGLDERIRAADVVVTGEGCLDATSLVGKVVGGVLERAEHFDKPVIVVVGSASDATARHVRERGHKVLVLAEHFGYERSLGTPLDLIAELVVSVLG
ncbi:glycerate kinase [Ferrimicrobium sp.]|uniref:glycerate kinase n=1 Tax=Ferrimicrobium sp. TaxID=2926050 RepID=UPI00262E45F5|nr:glycerate kinase [Ferrimicrobium sp.]MCL5972991.1 glycerate kinase [Actinomycetota bacterium]